MRLISRQMEVGLNVLQTMYMSRATKKIWQLPELGEALRESELLAYQVMRRLKDAGYVSSIMGARGGYVLIPGCEMRSLDRFFRDFNKAYVPSVTHQNGFASEVFVTEIVRCLKNTTLREVFLRHTAPENIVPINPDPGGAA